MEIIFTIVSTYLSLAFLDVGFVMQGSEASFIVISNGPSSNKLLLTTPSLPEHTCCSHVRYRAWLTAIAVFKYPQRYA
jgi:hypothetical protein